MAASLFGTGTAVNVNVSGTLVPQSFTGTAAQVLFTITAFTYTPGTNSLLIFINGQRQIAGRDFTETSSTTFTLVEGVVAGDFVDIIGFPLIALTQFASADAVNFTPAGTGAVVRTVQTKVRESVSVLDFGADSTGLTDSYTAFAAAWAAIKLSGGTLLIPPGSYLLNTTWTLDVDLTLPHNYKIVGYGATLLAGAAVTGFALIVYKGYNNFGVTIEGLQFNHRNNTTVNGCIQAQGAGNIRIINCTQESHNTKATYAAVELGPYTPGNANTNTFWGLIDKFTTRQRAGGDGTIAAVGIRIKGQANATTITNCSFNSVVDAIRLENDGVVAGFANAVRILYNNFEGVTNGITVAPTALDTAFPTGIQVAFNRVESATTFFNITGTAKTDSSYPPSLFNNYLTAGSVTNYLVNTNNQLIFSYEPSYFGVGARNYLGGPTGMSLIADGVGNNVVIANLSGNSAWNGGHLVLGAYHLWVDGGTGNLRIKGGVPASAADGVVVGTQT